MLPEAEGRGQHFQDLYVYFDDVTVSDSIVFSVHNRKQRFQKASFSNRPTLESVNFRMAPFSSENGLRLVWKGSKLRLK